MFVLLMTPADVKGEVEVAASLYGGTGISIGRQRIKVNLSGSKRQLRCMAYSSSSVSGSEAVASWISCIGFRIYFFAYLAALVVGTDLVLHPFMVAGDVPRRVWNQEDLCG